MVTREVFIDNEAKSQLREIFSYIERDSFQNTEKVDESHSFGSGKRLKLIGIGI